MIPNAQEDSQKFPIGLIQPITVDRKLYSQQIVCGTNHIRTYAHKFDGSINILTTCEVRNFGIHSFFQKSNSGHKQNTF